MRGEITGDRILDISDPVRILGWLFTGGAEPVCIKAADVNFDGNTDLSDSVALLSFLFLGGPAPARPYPLCGLDTAGDQLSCRHTNCP